MLLLTHIVEDISHTCRNLAVINGGKVLFHGTPLQLLEGARGHTWNIKTDGERPNGAPTVVSTLQFYDGAQYRVIGLPDRHYATETIEPGLEDGYMWLIREARSQAVAF